VKLATHLIYDAMRDEFDAAVVVSNDAELEDANGKFRKPASC